MRAIRPFLAIAGLAALVSGCTTAAPPAPVAPPAALAGSSWRVLGLNGGGVQSFKVTISFDEVGQVVGYASCNNYRSAYSQDGRWMAFAASVTMTSDRVCDLYARRIEQTFLATLGEVDHAGFTSSGSLILYSRYGRIVARPAPA